MSESLKNWIPSRISMVKILEKKEVKEALEDAKRLEQQPMPSKEKIVQIYKEGMDEAEKLKHLLQPSWFIRDVDHHPVHVGIPRKKKVTSRR